MLVVGVRLSGLAAFCLRDAAWAISDSPKLSRKAAQRHGKFPARPIHRPLLGPGGFTTEQQRGTSAIAR